MRRPSTRYFLNFLLLLSASALPHYSTFVRRSLFSLLSLPPFLVSFSVTRPISDLASVLVRTRISEYTIARGALPSF